MASKAHLGVDFGSKNVQILVVICSVVGKSHLDQPKWQEIGDYKAKNTNHHYNLGVFLATRPERLANNPASWSSGEGEGGTKDPP